MNITIRQLEIFASIASLGNVTKASEQLLISQSAASMALAEFEKQIGARLFNRSGKKLLLNEQGRALLPRAIELLTRTEEIQSMFAHDGQPIGNIRIGASSTIGNYLLPSLLGAFAERYPGIDFTLEVGNTNRIIHAILDFTIDIGFIEGLCNHPQIHTHQWRNDELVVFASPAHPLARRKTISMADLADARWMLREPGSGTREIFEKAVAGKIDNLNIGFELGHTEAIKLAVRNNLGISCLSRLTIADFLEIGAVVELPTPFLDLRRHFYCLIHKDTYQTAALKTLTTSVAPASSQ